MPLINKNYIDTGSGKQQNNSVKDVAEANLPGPTHQAEVDGESSLINHELIKMYSNQSKLSGAYNLS